MKHKTQHSCSECGGISPKWQGQCPHCLAWNTLIEEAHTPSTKGGPKSWTGERATLVSLDEVPVEQALFRMNTGSDELDRVLGGGLVEGSVVLIGGDPGIGKSTLLLQSLAALSDRLAVCYVSGEESPQQIALRANRLGLMPRAIPLLAEIRLESIRHSLEQHRPKIAVIDSIQTMYTEQLNAAPGSVSQVRECAAQLTRLAKGLHIALIMIGHVTKEGSIAGPRVLEHMVDTVLYFEGETHSNIRMIRAIKNRFGAVNELGLFAMTERGLKGVANPSAIFLSSYRDDVAGSCVLVTQEGSRPLLVEIQALVDASHSPQARRLCVGVESNRLSMLLAVLHRHAGVACFDQDVFLNAVGGVKITEPAADLAILLAISSSLRNRPLPEKMVVFGEVGLAGEVRPVPRGQERLREAAKLGFRAAIVPAANMPKQGIEGMHIYPVERLDQALEHSRSHG